MPEILIRPANREDLAAILVVYDELEFGQNSATELAQAEKIFDRMAQYPDYRVYVAVIEDQIVGVFALLIMDNLAHGCQPSGVVEDVAVHPAYQGRGIGRQMMEFAMQHCREAGCYKLSLSSNWRRDAAHRFYESLGFERHGYSYLVPLDH